MDYPHKKKKKDMELLIHTIRSTKYFVAESLQALEEHPGTS